MARYAISGAAGVASVTAATAGIVKAESAGASCVIYEWSVGPGAGSEDSNYTVRLKRQSTAGTWTAATPSPLDNLTSAASTVGGVASTAAGTGGTILNNWGFNQKAGYRYVCVPGGEFYVTRTAANGIILEYAVVQGTAVNYGSMSVIE
jgi:hypothetical protein